MKLIYCKAPVLKYKPLAKAGIIQTVQKQFHFSDQVGANYLKHMKLLSHYKIQIQDYHQTFPVLR